MLVTISDKDCTCFFRAAARAGKGAIVGFTLEKDGKLVCGASLEEAVEAVDNATEDQVA